MTLHILHIIDSLRFGGSERMLVDIANATVQTGNRASVLVTRSQTPMAALLDPSIEVTVLDRQKRVELDKMRQVARDVRANGVDVLHTHGRSSFAFAATLKALFGLGTPILMHDHYGKIEIDQSVPGWFKLVGRHFVAQYVGVSAMLRPWAKTAGLPDAKVTIIDNAIDLRPFEAPSPLALDVTEDKIVGAVVCGIRHEKGIAELLEAIARCETRDRLHVIVFGGVREPDYYARCMDLHDKLNLREQVTFWGECDNIPGALRAVDFGLIPSLSESGPLVLIELMAAGLPFVATEVGSIARRVAEVGPPAFVPPGDTDALAREVDHIVALSSAGRKARGEGGRKICQEFFDIDTVIQQWLSLYRSMRG